MITFFTGIGIISIAILGTAALILLAGVSAVYLSDDTGGHW